VRRRRAALLVSLGAIAAVGGGLTSVGLSLVRNSTAGEAVDPPPTPDEPGYEALVRPTPTLLTIHEGDEGDVAGASLLTLHPNDDGGAVVLVPPSTRVPFGDQGEITVEEAYQAGGSGVVARLLGDLLDIVVDDDLVIDDEQWEALTEPVEPITVQLTDAVEEWPAGEVPLLAEEVGPYLGALAPEESELDRLNRHGEFWVNWLPLVRDAGDRAVPGEVDVGIGRFVRGLANGATVSVLPVTPVAAGADDDGGDGVAGPGDVGGDVAAGADDDGGDVAAGADDDGGATEDRGTQFEADETRMAELVASAVPFPVSPGPDSRPRVRLLNGTTDDDIMAAASRRLVEGGGAVAITGNASSFDVPDTIFAYRPGISRQDVERLAEAFGLGTVEEADPPGLASGGDEGPEADIDVTIVLGRDAQDLIRRLDNADG
jgi:hypothetical protein